MKHAFSLLKTLPLLLILIATGCFFYFHLYLYLTFDSLREHHDLFLAWTKRHYFEAVCFYMLLFTVSEATAVPGSTFFTILGGFLFGTILAAIYAILSVTMGGVIFFIAIKISLGEWLLSKSGKTAAAIKRWEKGFRDDAVIYLLMLRLFPFLPFWITNAVAGVAGVRLFTFCLVTLIGVAPSLLICASIGHGLGSVLNHDHIDSFVVVFQQYLLLPLVGLAVLSVCPLIYKLLKPKKAKR